MTGYGTAFGRGMVVGLGAALLYAAARETAAIARGVRERTQPEGEHDRLIDWRWAESVAARISGPGLILHPNAKAQLQHEYRGLLARIEGPIGEYTGNQLSLDRTSVDVMDRPDWIRANLATFRDLLEPVEMYYREQTARAGLVGSITGPALHQAARLTLSAQMGLLVGYLSRRVLGQYDLSLLGTEPIDAGKLYFVEPNLRQVEQVLGVPRDELRLWVAMHEATHAHEFEVHPWVREYLNTTLRSYLRLLIEDMGKQSGENPLLSLTNRLVANLRRGQNLINALMTPQQRELMSRLQALMSLAEGYSNHVMNVVGRSALPSFDLIHERVEHRQRERSQAEMLFLRITGLSMKMEQYKRGEEFVDEVVRQRSMAFANRAWESPEMLPTEHEIREPRLWIARVEASAA